jgi:hypothetical protein
VAEGAPHQFAIECFPCSYNYTSVRSDRKRESANALRLNHLVLFMWTNDQQMPPPCLKHSMKFEFTKCITFHIFLWWLDRGAHMLILLPCIQVVPSSILGWDPNYTILKYLVTFFGPPVTWWDMATNLAKPLPSTLITIYYSLTILPFDAYNLSY